MDPYLSEISVFPENFAPKNWALCRGQILSIDQNQALFSFIGTTYGGDGSTSFALQDLRVRLLVGPEIRIFRVQSNQACLKSVLSVSDEKLANHCFSVN